MPENSKSLGDYLSEEGKRKFMGRLWDWFSRLNPFGKMSDRSISKSYSLTNALLYGPPKLDLDRVCVSLDDENELEDDSTGMVAGDDFDLEHDIGTNINVPPGPVPPVFEPGYNVNPVVYGPPRRDMDFRREENRPDNE